ncbi:sperm motility kinase Y-like [Sycon ciliatum]|uniref:sperm motility kinase Y-like n=1 Tax=Sycon ciliatum TaxID=27933 RepID=UPI0031F6E492
MAVIIQLDPNIFGTIVHYDDETTGKVDGVIQIGGRVLGKGAFGDVLPARFPGEDKIVAKFIKKTESQQVDICTEAAISLKLRHPCIVPCFGALQTEKSAILFFKRIHGRTLAHWAENIRALVNRNPSEDEVRPIMFQLLHGLHYLQTAKIAHFDLHAHNVMVDDSGTAIILDFGMAHDYHSIKRGVFMPASYSYPPECVIRDMGVDHKCDVFLCAGMMYLVLFRRGPFGFVNLKGVAPAKHLDNVLAGMCQDPWNGPHKSSSALQTLMSKCLAYSPEDRPDAAEALCYEWFKATPGYSKLHLTDYVPSTPPTDFRELDKEILETICKQWESDTYTMASAIITNSNGPAAIAYRNAQYISNKFFSS